MQNNGLFEQVLAFFIQARIRFGQEATSLWPFAVKALDKIKPPELQAKLIAGLWSKVHDGLAERQLADDGQRWQLEYADFELVRGLWEKAREHYLGLCGLRDVPPDLKAKACLRLGALNLAAPPGTDAAAPPAQSPSDPLFILLALDNLPEEYKLAAKLLAAAEGVRVAELDARLKLLNAPSLLTPPEWSLFRGLRLRLDGNAAAARDAFVDASGKAGYSSAWVGSLARYLLHPPDDQGKNNKEAGH
jgi:hypothetical protein